MEDNKKMQPGEDRFDELLSASLPEEPSPEISKKVTPWTDALRLIVLGLACSLINIEGSTFFLILQTAGFAFSLLGWNRLRGENDSFRRAWILQLIRTGWFLVNIFFNMTVYSLNDLVPISADVSFLLNIVFSLLFLVQLVNLRDGIEAVQKKAGAEPDSKAVSMLLIAFVLMFVFALFTTHTVVALLMLIVVAAGLVNVVRLSHALDEAGYAVTPSPVRLSREKLLGIFFGILILGSLLSFLFFSRYPMKWQQRETAAEASVSEIGVPSALPDVDAVSAQLLELGFPEEVLADLSAEDIQKCAGAAAVMHSESTVYDSGVSTIPSENSVRLTAVAVVLSEQPRVWRIIYHFSLPDQNHYWGTETLKIIPFNLLGSEEFTEPLHGRILVGKGSETRTAQIPSVTNDYLDGGQDLVFGGFSILSANSGNAWFASFSLPNGYENARGYVALTVRNPYPTIVNPGEEANAQIRERYNYGLSYTHQVRAFAYPVQSAKDSLYRSLIRDSGVFRTLQLQQVYFFPE